MCVICEHTHFTETYDTSSLSALNRRDGCAHCSTTAKSGKSSCCARGGAWFKNCGDAGDTNFTHTWSEGIQACKAFSSSVSVKSSLQIPVGHVDGIYNPLNVSQSRNTTPEQTDVYAPGSMFNAVITNSRDCGRGMDFVVYIYVLFIVSYSQT